MTNGNSISLHGKRNYANLHDHRQRKVEEEMQDKRKWEQEARAEEAKADEKARSSSTAESQGMQGAMPPVYAETSQATGEQGAMPPASSSGAEQLPHEVPKARRPRPLAPARPDYDPPTDEELRRWKEQDRKRKEYEKQRETQAVSYTHLTLPTIYSV